MITHDNFTDVSIIMERIIELTYCSIFVGQ